MLARHGSTASPCHAGPRGCSVSFWRGDSAATMCALFSIRRSLHFDVWSLVSCSSLFLSLGTRIYDIRRHTSNLLADVCFSRVTHAARRRRRAHRTPHRTAGASRATAQDRPCPHSLAPCIVTDSARGLAHSDAAEGPCGATAHRRVSRRARVRRGAGRAHLPSRRACCAFLARM